jgi:hypothetical protein
MEPEFREATFSPVSVPTGTAANGIFAGLLPLDRPRCIWTCSSPVAVLAAATAAVRERRRRWPGR